MGIVEWYLLFAITTSCAFLYEILTPVFLKLEKYAPTSNLVENKKLTYLVFFLVNIIAAPVVFFPCIVPGIGETFRDALFNTLVKTE